jgi:release factor glutamine methyltransferase
LYSAGVEHPWKNVCLIGQAVCQCSYEEFRFGQPLLGDVQKKMMWDSVQRRARHEPLAKILGVASFWKFHFLTSQDTLDPRPESELFPDVVLKRFPATHLPLTFLDLGTGTGCLLISCLAEYPNASGIGVDKSEQALKIAKENAKRCGVEERACFVKSYWNNEISGSFDIILCNPPYIKLAEKLGPDVLFDPPEALFGGDDGLACYREIFPNLIKNIHPSTQILMECGRWQNNHIIEIAAQNGFHCSQQINDLQSIPRLLVFTLATMAI